MFEHDHSAARGKMCMRKLFVFKHDSLLGNAPSSVLFDKITVQRNENVLYPRNFSDYTITVDNQMPSGVQLITKL
jgi:CRISPR-associated protein Csd2